MLRSPAHMIGPTATAPSSTTSGLFDSCHRKIRLIGVGPVAFLGGLVARARRKERDDVNHGDTKLYLDDSVLELMKLSQSELRSMVDMPAGLDYNEWLASFTLSIFESVNLVYGTISEYCTTHGCQEMTAPGLKTYQWYDEKGKKSRLPAPHYCDFAMTYIQRTVNDESIFPTKYANIFPTAFEQHVRKILRLLFHVIAHIYYAHFREISLLGLHPHLNTTFALFTALNRRFNLIESKETEVLADLEVALHLTDDAYKTPSVSSSSANSLTAMSCNNLSSNNSSFTNLNNNYNSKNHSNTIVTQAIISTTQIRNSPLSGYNSAIGSASVDGINSSYKIDGDVNVMPIVKQPPAASAPSTPALVMQTPIIGEFFNNNDLHTKDKYKDRQLRFDGNPLRNHSPPYNNLTTI